jgi:hypothetical protein
MRMVKQRPITDGTITIDCGVCPVAMLTDLPYEKVLADIPHYRATSHHDWMRYFNLLTLFSTRRPTRDVSDYWVLSSAWQSPTALEVVVST